MTDDLFAGRELCPDGACIGIIGPDGLCRECGRVGRSAVSDPRLRHLTPLPGDEPAAAAVDDPDEAAGELPDDDFANRVLCPDGTCIGLIGEDGKCKECDILVE